LARIAIRLSDSPHNHARALPGSSTWLYLA
jgi:hypothetical protein